METYILKEDIKLLCVNADSFPQGVEAAFKKLHGLLSTMNGRKLYGISYPKENKEIIYKAAAEESFEGEGEKLKLETFVIKKGKYIGTRIVNYMDHIESVGNTFKKIIGDPRIDPQGCCVEVYLNEKDVRCMVRLDIRS